VRAEVVLMRRCLVVANQTLGGDQLALPERRSRWLATDLPGRIRRTYKLPVTQATGTPHAPEG